MKTFFLATILTVFLVLTGCNSTDPASGDNVTIVQDSLTLNSSNVFLKDTNYEYGFVFVTDKSNTVLLNTTLTSKISIEDTTGGSITDSIPTYYPYATNLVYSNGTTDTSIVNGQAGYYANIYCFKKDCYGEKVIFTYSY